MTDAPHMSVAEVAKLIGVSRQTVYDWAGSGGIPHLRIGRRILFPRRAVLVWWQTAGGTVPLPDTTEGCP